MTGVYEWWPLSFEVFDGAVVEHRSRAGDDKADALLAVEAHSVGWLAEVSAANGDDLTGACGSGQDGIRMRSPAWTMAVPT